jgi:hypothetical protein
VLDSIQFLPDPCPLPSHEKKRSLTSEEHLLYAPFSGVGGVVYDKDAVYIDLGGSQHGRYIKEQQEKEKKLLQLQFVQSGVTVSIITLVVAVVVNFSLSSMKACFIPSAIIHSVHLYLFLRFLLFNLLLSN